MRRRMRADNMITQEVPVAGLVWVPGVVSPNILGGSFWLPPEMEGRVVEAGTPL
jgi:hypothetical protein